MIIVCELLPSGRFKQHDYPEVVQGGVPPWGSPRSIGLCESRGARLSTTCGIPAGLNRATSQPADSPLTPRAGDSCETHSPRQRSTDERESGRLETSSRGTKRL